VSAPEPRTLHPAELLHLLTLGGAGILGLDHRVGNFDPGKDADLVVVDPGRHAPLARRLDRLACGSAGERLFALIMGMGRETVCRTVVRGRVVCVRRPE
jgi:guanine deaminase